MVDSTALFDGAPKYMAFPKDVIGESTRTAAVKTTVYYILLLQSLTSMSTLVIQHT